MQAEAVRPQVLEERWKRRSTPPRTATTRAAGHDRGVGSSPQRLWRSVPRARVALLPAREGAPAGAPRVTVPPETLARSTALTAAPKQVPSGQDDGRVRVPHTQLPAVAAEIAAGVPYPPGAGESMDWEALPANPRDMSSVNFRSDVQMLVEYRAACTWVAFWLHAFGTANAPALGAATTVLRDVPAWPTFRGQPADDMQVFWNGITAAASARDPGPLRRQIELNCRSVPTPWS